MDFKKIQDEVAELWKDKGIVEKARAKGKKDFYFLDGPPYTSGKVHIGTAWNKSLKDMVLRYKRMRGHKVWDRAGYDMHGLPTEHATEKELGIRGRAEIEEFGIEKFIEECRKVCCKNLEDMNKEFENLGVWMDFDNAYRTISKDYMEGEWWLIKKAHEKGRLYEGERSMTWDAHSATALAKHELEYVSVTDTSIYVRLHVEKDTYLMIWTTTPWTIPFNLAVMAGPDIEYAKVKVNFEGEGQHWILAKELLEDFITDKLGIEYDIVEEFLGSELEGISYTHPFSEKNKIYSEMKKEMPKVHTVLLSKEYVDTAAGTGLVHCAPGCGPEDYEVGHRNGIRPFNTLDVHGVCQDFEPFTGIKAKDDDDKFISMIEEQKALVHVHKYTHDYPFGERSKKPVIFRVTKQWFLKVEDFKDKLIAENDKIKWVPDAAYNAFNSWLENLRDNSISRQRYWGTPLPIWRNTENPEDYIVVGSAKELSELAGVEEPDDLHIPTVNKIVITKDGKEYERVPDVLDVWVDAGTASWNCLDFPSNKENFERLFPADFILEGKDQIRGWFNLLHIASMVALERPSFKAVYMHGFVNDAKGRKMSKSLGNYILPGEVTEKYGVDASRYYMLGAANPGFDMNYNFSDLEVKFRNLIVFWNTHKFLLEVAENPVPISELDLGIEEKYILSRLQTEIKEATEIMEAYRLNELPDAVERFLLDISRTYIQLVRDKAQDESQLVSSVLSEAFLKGITMLAPICPYFSEMVYQNLKESINSSEESIHLRSWPEPEETLVDKVLEQDMVVSKAVIAGILESRDKAQLGIRWPVKAVHVSCSKAEKESLERMQDLIMLQTNIKLLSFDPIELEYEIRPNSRNIGKDFGDQTGDVMNIVKTNQEKLTEMVKKEEESLKIDGKEIKASYLNIRKKAPESYVMGSASGIDVLLDKTRTEELDREGFARELVRRIQQLRKDSGLVKSDRVKTQISGIELKDHQDSIGEKTGSVSVDFVDKVDSRHKSRNKVKGKEFTVGFSQV